MTRQKPSLVTFILGALMNGSYPNLYWDDRSTGKFCFKCVCRNSREWEDDYGRILEDYRKLKGRENANVSDRQRLLMAFRKSKDFKEIEDRSSKHEKHYKYVERKISSVAHCQDSPSLPIQSRTGLSEVSDNPNDYVSSNDFQLSQLVQNACGSSEEIVYPQFYDAHPVSEGDAMNILLKQGVRVNSAPKCCLLVLREPNSLNVSSTSADHQDGIGFQNIIEDELPADKSSSTNQSLQRESSNWELSVNESSADKSSSTDQSSERESSDCEMTRKRKGTSDRINKKMKKEESEHDNGPSAYERMVQMNIAENKKFLEKSQINDKENFSQSVKQMQMQKRMSKKVVTNIKKIERKPLIPTRRSSRLSKANMNLSVEPMHQRTLTKIKTEEAVEMFEDSTMDSLLSQPSSSKGEAPVNGQLPSTCESDDSTMDSSLSQPSSSKGEALVNGQLPSIFESDDSTMDSLFQPSSSKREAPVNEQLPSTCESDDSTMDPSLSQPSSSKGEAPVNGQLPSIFESDDSTMDSSLSQTSSSNGEAPVNGQLPSIFEYNSLDSEDIGHVNKIRDKGRNPIQESSDEDSVYHNLKSHDNATDGCMGSQKERLSKDEKYYKLPHEGRISSDLESSASSPVQMDSENVAFSDTQAINYQDSPHLAIGSGTSPSEGDLSIFVGLGFFGHCKTQKLKCTRNITSVPDLESVHPSIKMNEPLHLYDDGQPNSNYKPICAPDLCPETQASVELVQVQSLKQVVENCHPPNKCTLNDDGWIN